MSSEFMELDTVTAEKLVQNFLHDRIDEKDTALLYRHLSKKLLHSLIKPGDNELRLRPQEQFILAGIALFPSNKTMRLRYIERLQSLRREQFERSNKPSNN